jgi:hypothetical protein
MDRRLDTFRIGMMASNLPNLSQRLSVPLTLEPALPARIPCPSRRHRSLGAHVALTAANARALQQQQAAWERPSKLPPPMTASQHANGQRCA